MKDGNSVVNFINRNYGLAGPEYIKFLSDCSIQELFDTKVKEILDGTGTSEKQAMAMALIMAADELTGLAFYPDEAPLTVEEVKPFLKVQDDIDPAERSYREIVGVIMEHEVNFKPDVNTARWGRMGTDSVLINKFVLSRELQSLGFNFDAVKKKWAEKGYLVKSTSGRYANYTKVDNAKDYYVRLKFDAA